MSAENFVVDEFSAYNLMARLSENACDYDFYNKKIPAVRQGFKKSLI